MMDYEDTTAFLGQWGRYQQIAFFLICASMVPNGVLVFAIVFAGDTPDHHCLVPKVNLSQDWRDAIIPIQMDNKGKEVPSRCSRYRLDVVRNFSDQGLVPGRDVNLTDLEQESCVDGWSYSKDIYQSTLVTQFDLVCGDQWKQPFSSTVFFLGVLTGTFTGQLSDRFGRKPVMFGFIALQSLSTIAQAFSTSWPMFCVFYFLTGLGRVSSYLSSFVLGSEILTGKVRVFFSSMGVCVSFAIGYMFLPLFAYYLRDWKHLLFGLSLPGLVYLPLWWFIPESPRWLLSRGRVEEAKAILRKAAKMNKVEAPQVIFKDYGRHANENTTDSKKGYNIFHLLKTSNIRIITLILCLTWFTLSTGYYGLSLNSSQMHPNPFISSFLSAAVEVPAYISVWVALRFCRRKLCLLTILVFAAASLFFIQLVPEGQPNITMTLAMLGKGIVTAGTSMIYVFLAELYPTVLRNTASGACSILARVGGSTASFFFKLDSYVRYLPYIVLGSLAAVSALAVLFLPETFGKDLPQTIQEMPEAKRIPCLRGNRKEHLAPVVVMESPL